MNDRRVLDSSWVPWLRRLALGICLVGAVFVIVSVAKAPKTGLGQAGEGWQILLSESFEAGIGVGWTVRDESEDDGGAYTWAANTFLSSSASHSVWCVGGGEDGGDQLVAGEDTYPSNVDSWLIHGPVDLSGASDARLRFDWWLETGGAGGVQRPWASLQTLDRVNVTPEEGDWLGWCILTGEDDLEGASCTYVSGSTGNWASAAVPLDEHFGSRTGVAERIWIAFRFVSDDDGVGGRGAFVDDVMVEVRREAYELYFPHVRKEPRPTPTPTPTATPSPTPKSSPVPADLENGSFEGGTTRETTYWTSEGGPYHGEFGEISTPSGWVTWWREGFPCSGTGEHTSGRPEVKVIDPSFFPDPERWRSGQRATLLFTYWRCHEMGLYQEVPVEEGREYAVEAYGHAWYSRCSSEPHGPPLEDDCRTPITWAHDLLRVGIDPDGGVDFDEVIWSVPVEVYGQYDDPVRLERVRARGSTVTVWLYAEATHPLKHNDVYWDDVTLEVIR